MEQWSTAYRAYGAVNNMDKFPVQSSNIGNQMVVAKSPPRILDLPPLRHQQAEKAKKTSSSSNSWWNDSEMKRKRRVAKYKLYSAEGKLKASLRKGYRWLRHRCSRVIRGF